MIDPIEDEYINHIYLIVNIIIDVLLMIWLALYTTCVIRLHFNMDVVESDDEEDLENNLRMK